MHNLLIVEDDSIQKEELFLSILKRYPNWNIICAEDFNEAKQIISDSIVQKDYFSLFLLDVQLKEDPCDFGGFVLAGEIRSLKPYYTTPILFLTSVSEKTQFALANYHCYNYITKPYLTSDVIFQIQQMLQTGFLEENSITIIDTNRIRHRVILKDICYIETRSHSLVLSTLLGDITTREFTFSSLFTCLNGDFIQCHKKYIININHITNYDKTNRFVQVNQQNISVSRTYKQDVEKLLTERKILE